MTTNARDEKWSEWYPNNGVDNPIPDGAFYEVKDERGEVTPKNLLINVRWRLEGDGHDIIAYRYKIKEPESDMHPDLEWLARNVSEWRDGVEEMALDSDGEVRHYPGVRLDYFPEDIAGAMRAGSPVGDNLYSKSKWEAARQQLGLDSTGIAEADEEECLQLAYERMGDESVKVSVDDLQDNVNKPKHYQLREGYEVYDLRQDLAAKAANGGATYDQYSDWDRAIEYIIRMWGKNQLEDAKKGRWYLDKLIGKLEAEESAR